MEQKSVVELFGRSLQNGMGYPSMLSDGDTNTIKEIHQLDPYPGMKVEKLELINIWPSVSTLEDIIPVRESASKSKLGMFQDQDLPHRYASRKLLPREGRYSAIEREALALVFAVAQFQQTQDHTSMSGLECVIEQRTGLVVNYHTMS
ncbi:hypothetical protein PoB_004259100 [Plakobranchus ocellatus]|uniref:Reverse transcriptase RNase H-like domain-containing protein n=1 Tax=Plakobranchus ocellatus TaxID=259542 RepID=A0AAV4B6K7_9GAST|nr:hypothetical protein PoB_004259100 [Plakobranchus ocellatus]